MNFSSSSHLSTVLGGALVFLIALAVLPTVIQQFNQSKVLVANDTFCQYNGERFVSVSPDWSATPLVTHNLVDGLDGKPTTMTGATNCPLDIISTALDQTFETPGNLQIVVPKDIATGSLLPAAMIGSVSGGIHPLTGTVWNAAKGYCSFNGMNFLYIMDAKGELWAADDENYKVVAGAAGACAAEADTVVTGGTGLIPTSDHYILPSLVGSAYLGQPLVLKEQVKLNTTIVNLLPLVILVAGLLAAGGWIYNARRSSA